MTRDDFYFIKTTDKETADILKQDGLLFLYKRGDVYVFSCKLDIGIKYSKNSNCVFSSVLTF